MTIAVPDYHTSCNIVSFSDNIVTYCDNGFPENGNGPANSELGLCVCGP